jgi:glycosyltransferase involved in cell wall biosynthesis
MLKRVGVGIVTRNRNDFVGSLINNISSCANIDSLVVINDSEEDLIIKDINIINNHTNIGVGKTKNKALQYLIADNCDYIFILEDDLIIHNTEVFSKYIKASEETGIQHFNYGPGTPFNRKQNTSFDLHNRDTLDVNSKPAPKVTIDYGNNVQIDLYEHCAGVLSFFTINILKQVGLHDEAFFNAWEHVDHTMRIIKGNAHPPFWWFADITGSADYLSTQSESISRSVTAEDKTTWMDNINKGREIYKAKHGFYPNMCPVSNQQEVLQKLKEIKNTWKN